MRTGRPTKLTAELGDQIAALVRAGIFPYVAAGACGVGRATFFAWMDPGSRKRRRRLFRDFRDKVHRAADEARAAAEAAVYAGDKLSWLRYGPGRERPGEPGWTNSAEITMAHDPAVPLRIEVIYVDQPPAEAHPTDRQLREIVDGDGREA
jgi:hypothetical protein